MTHSLNSCCCMPWCELPEVIFTSSSSDSLIHHSQAPKHEKWNSYIPVKEQRKYVRIRTPAFLWVAPRDTEKLSCSMSRVCGTATLVTRFTCSNVVMLSSSHTSPNIPLKAVKPRNLVNDDRFRENKAEPNQQTTHPSSPLKGVKRVLG